MTSKNQDPALKDPPREEGDARSWSSPATRAGAAEALDGAKPAASDPGKAKSDVAPVSRLAPPPKPRQTQPDLPSTTQATGARASRPSEPPQAPATIQAMRIIEIVGSTEPVLDDGRIEQDVYEELAQEDVAPDSEEEVSVETDEIAVTVSEEAAELAPEGEARPPPPPKREGRPSLPLPPPPPPLSSAEQQVRVESAARAQRQQPKGQRRPWWEDMFSQDFQRAHVPLPVEYVRKETDFIESSLGIAAGGIVLDLGCGEGYYSVELASRGYGVVGYDLSLYQLALAADVADERKQKINFLQGDMREMAFEETFDGVLCWNTTFGYFEEEKNYSVVQRIYRALRPGGTLLLDIANRDYIAARTPSQVWYQGDSCVCMDDVSLDFITSRLRVKRSVILDDGEKRQVQYSMRLYSMHELGKLLHDVGFLVAEASGDTTTRGTFLGAHSPRIIMLAQRPE